MNAGIISDFFKGGKRGIICHTPEEVMSVYDVAKAAFGRERMLGFDDWDEEDVSGWLRRDGMTVISIDPSNPDDLLGYADVSWHLHDGWDLYDYNSVFGVPDIEDFDIDDILG